MKKAIEILKDAVAHKPDADVERAISYLSDLTQCTAPEWELNPELDGLLKIKTIDGLKVEDGPYAKEFAIEQNRLDMEATNREEKEAGVVPEEIPLQYQTCKHGTAFRYHCDECDDDDLGELDPTKACGFGDEGCTSCQ